MIEKRALYNQIGWGLLFLFIANVGFLRLLPKVIVKCASYGGIVLSSSNLMTKYSMGIGVRVVGLLFFLFLMKKWGILQWYQWKMNKSILLVSWIFFVYIVMNIEVVPIKNLEYSPVILMIIECLMIGIFEETVFRGMLLPLFLKKYGNGRREIFGSVLICNLLFGAFHIINLMTGASLISVISQVFYCIMLGIAFSALLLRTNNNLLWCGILHGLYDIASGFGDFAIENHAIPSGNISIWPYIWNLCMFIPIMIYGLFLLRKIKKVTPEGVVVCYDKKEEVDTN